MTGSMDRPPVRLMPTSEHKSVATSLSDRRAPHHSGGEPVLALQHWIGNRAVASRLGGLVVQRKLKVSSPGDTYEQEAERVSERVMRIVEPERDLSRLRADPGVQRKRGCCGDGATGGCAECQVERLAWRREAGPGSTETASRVVEDVLHEPGQPLDAATRDFVEPRFGRRFGDVRVHTGAKAAESAAALKAFAYTVGANVVFGSGAYAPRAEAGRQLLAHELTHVIQQGGGRPPAGQTTTLRGQVQRQVSPPLAPGGDVGRLLERDRPAAGVPPTAASERRPQSLTCTPGPGIPNTVCSAYGANSWWLPRAYVNNATCACQETPNEPTANCVRRFLQHRMAATPPALKIAAAAQKPMEPAAPYQAFVQAFLTPRIYRDHVDAYGGCCCPSGPAPYPAWIGVTTVPLPCSRVGSSIRTFGSCHGTPGRW
jgi:uncharacterized protein DUF4157